ncbi:MAG: ankyrin repeat domain-containing protein [Planctomycetota bacterium]
MADRPTSSSARKHFPVNPSLEHLQKQAKRRAKQQPDLTLAKAQHLLVKEYGCRDWVELTRVVATMSRQASRDAFEELPKAVNARDLDQIKAILASGEFTQHDLDLALACSALRFDERGEIARLLLDHGADPDGQYGSAGYGPIVFLTGEGLEPEGLAFLLDAGCDVTFAPIDTKYGKHGVMSHWLGTYVRGRNEPKHRGLRLLLDADPDLVHRRYSDMPYGHMRLRGATLLHLAIDFQEAECVDLLLDRGANINAQADVVTDDEGDTFGGQSPIFHAIDSWMGYGRTLLKSLVERLGNDINWTVEGSIKFYDGVKGPFTARQWLEQNLDELAIVRAATKDAGEANAGIPAEMLNDFGKALVGKGGDIDRVRRMLDREPRLANCNPWSPGWAGSAVEAVAGMCVWHKPAEHAIARLLVERGAMCSLQTAARAGLLSEVKREADERGWVFNEVDVKGRTLMYRAACVYGKFHEGEAVADYLIEKGARVDLFSACTLGMLDRVQALLADDASLATEPDPEGMTALHWAVRNRRDPGNAVVIVEALLDAGADFEAVNPTEDGMRPLHHCGEWSSPREVAELLIDRGADVNARAGESGWTPLDYAIDRGRDEMASLLRERGGVVGDRGE